MLTRRRCLGGCGALLFGLAGVKAAEARHNPVYGCSLTPTEASNILGNKQDARAPGDPPMILQSGDKDFDFALAQTLSMLSDCLNVTPHFAYYDDYDGPNALASRTKHVAGTDGTVLFGQRLLKKMMADAEAREAAVAGVCAHEFGHILQYKLDLDTDLLEGQPTVKRVELNADFFAGYFAGVRKRQSPSFNAAAIALAQFNSGDDMLNHPAHHGTKNERGQVIVKGFETSYNDRKPLLDAIQIGVNYVKAKF